MLDDIRMYNYNESGRLITKMEQAKEYLDSKFAGVGDVDFTDVNQSISKLGETITTDIETKIEDAMSDVSQSITNLSESITTDIDAKIDDAKSDIIEAFEDSKPCLCNLATKQDVCKAKSEIIGKITEADSDIKAYIDEKFVDINEQVGSDEEDE